MPKIKKKKKSFYGTYLSWKHKMEETYLKRRIPQKAKYQCKLPSRRFHKVYGSRTRPAYW